MGVVVLVWSEAVVLEHWCGSHCMYYYYTCWPRFWETVGAFQHCAQALSMQSIIHITANLHVVIILCFLSWAGVQQQRNDCNDSHCLLLCTHSVPTYTVHTCAMNWMECFHVHRLGFVHNHI